MQKKVEEKKLCYKNLKILKFDVVVKNLKNRFRGFDNTRK